mmetsp:Transcript_27926/g.83690  ORF Transcript_27926/g.83690 Transcript_27926/m.83690 type:complete len:306 (+) Transcript_27926:1356-2273(+)
MGDDALLLKYLNPHLVAIVTESQGGSEAPLLDPRLRAAANDSQAEPPSLFVTLVDTVSASVVHRASVPHGGAPARAIVSENWVVYSYWNHKAKRAEVGALTLVEGHIDRFGLSPFKVPEQRAETSSFAAAPPVAFQRTFALNKPVTALGATATRRGIASKHILLGVEPGQLNALDRRALDPRRPVVDEETATRAAKKKVERELMEGLRPYAPFVPLNPKAMVSYDQRVVGLAEVHATDAKLESTSLVLALGVDVFGARHTPSGAFDLIAEDFSYALLLLLLFGMLAVTLMLKRAAAKKSLDLLWI